MRTLLPPQMSLLWDGCQMCEASAGSLPSCITGVSGQTIDSLYAAINGTLVQLNLFSRAHFIKHTVTLHYNPTLIPLQRQYSYSVN
ncbi:hypothetical protein BDZ91DRAFT_399078 [Kalaharituber pfeilii]|nr:hypothetical protein BDZ91DRAFT_399078 [Kalaharituber pfeilii]